MRPVTVVVNNRAESRHVGDSVVRIDVRVTRKILAAGPNARIEDGNNHPAAIGVVPRAGGIDGLQVPLCTEERIVRYAMRRILIVELDITNALAQRETLVGVLD